jgi:hypothetical protein
VESREEGERVGQDGGGDEGVAKGWAEVREEEEQRVEEADVGQGRVGLEGRDQADDQDGR